MVQMAMLKSGVILDESLTFRLDPEAALAHQESMLPARINSSGWELAFDASLWQATRDRATHEG